MLKWFSNHGHSGSGQAGSAFVGKTLRINDYTVVVEEVVAEGKLNSWQGGRGEGG